MVQGKDCLGQPRLLLNEDEYHCDDERMTTGALALFLVGDTFDVKPVPIIGVEVPPCSRNFGYCIYRRENDSNASQEDCELKILSHEWW